MPLKDGSGAVFAFAERERPYGYLDPAGAVESAARAKAHLEGVRVLESSAADIDPEVELQRNVVRFPAPPQAPVAATLEPSDKAHIVLTALNEPAGERAERLTREIDSEIEKQLARFNSAARKGRSS
ncbi:MAG: hypothetical protein HC855_15670 [Rhizobiales bacterium]|nr:hypothetical protein [Hyphomicrobiales bacterium]